MCFTRPIVFQQPDYQLLKRHLLRTPTQHTTDNDSFHTRTVSPTIELVCRAVSFKNFKSLLFRNLPNHLLVSPLHISFNSIFQLKAMLLVSHRKQLNFSLVLYLVRSVKFFLPKFQQD